MVSNVTPEECLVAAIVCSSLSKVSDDMSTRKDQFYLALKTHSRQLPQGVVIVTVAIAKLASRHLYAVVATSDGTLYVAFRGTKSFADALVDAQFVWGLDAHGGRLHRGFAGRANAAAPEYLMFLATDQSRVCKTRTGRGAPAKRVVLCGHSLGGAVAQIAALRLKVQLEAQHGHITSRKSTTRGQREQTTTIVAGDVACITFGSPGWGDAGIRNLVDTHKWTGCFQNFIHANDRIPTLLQLDATLHMLDKGTRSISEAVGAILGGPIVRGLHQTLCAMH